LFFGGGDGGEPLPSPPAERPDLILLGLAMPVLDGFGFLRAFRPASSIPIIMLTTWDAATDAITVAGLELGADDCLTKPVRLLELHARIQTLLRRTTPSSA
jgi:DNA-binding response OmpR family regulator